MVGAGLLGSLQVGSEPRGPGHCPSAVWNQASAGPRSPGIEGSCGLSRPALPSREGTGRPWEGSGRAGPGMLRPGLAQASQRPAVVTRTDIALRPIARHRPLAPWGGVRCWSWLRRRRVGGRVGGESGGVGLQSNGRGPWPHPTTSSSPAWSGCSWAWRGWMWPLGPASSAGQDTPCKGHTRTVTHSPRRRPPAGP